MNQQRRDAVMDSQDGGRWTDNRVALANGVLKDGYTRTEALDAVVAATWNNNDLTEDPKEAIEWLIYAERQINAAKAALRQAVIDELNAN